MKTIKTVTIPGTTGTVESRVYLTVEATLMNKTLKTAEEILLDELNDNQVKVIETVPFMKHWVIEAMEEYANQFKTPLAFSEKERADMISKLNSIYLCLSAHPDNEENSEFEDRITDLEEITEILKAEQLKDWKDFSTEKPPIGTEVLAHSPEWVHPDFNESGIRIGFIDLDEEIGPFVSAKWWNDQDDYISDHETKPLKWKHL